MATLPEPKNSIQNLIDAYHETQAGERPRPYLGASILGHHCDRWLWLTFRWAVIEKFPGRMLRLFRRGNREEETVASDLRAIGVDLTETGRYQRDLDFGCHVKGHPDGIILSGVPEAPKTAHVWECKTTNKKGFDELVAKGVTDAKPMHYVQMQLCMMRSGLTRALYTAVCKEDDEMHVERVRYDKDVAERYLRRGQTLALEEHMPPAIGGPDWYQCKFCAAYQLCHQTHVTKEVNCRTCAHSTAKADGTWYCERWHDIIPLDAQYGGCRAHSLHPDLVPWELDYEQCTVYTAAYKIGEQVVLNGEDGYSSKEVLAGGPFDDAVVDLVRSTFKGEVAHA